MHTNLYQEYLAALARRSRDRTDQAVACLPFLVDPLFRRSDDAPADPTSPPAHPNRVTMVAMS
jgi:hypothetical protein